MRTGKTHTGIGLNQLRGIRRAKSERTWVLVGNQAEAKILQRDTAGDGGFQVLYRFHHPEGKLKSHELGTDRPGRSFDSPRSGRSKAAAHRHTYASSADPREQSVNRFVAALANWLDAERKLDRYDRLLIVAEPRFLGKMKANLDGGTSERLLPPLDRDFNYLTEGELMETLNEEL